MRLREFICSLILITAAFVAPFSFGQRGEQSLWDVVLNAHRASRLNAPTSVKIMGVSTRATGTQPITITATNLEETLLEIGKEKEVATPARFFRDDGEQSVRHNTPAGFAQLDVTGVFLISQLRNREVKTTNPVSTTFRGRDAWLIHVAGNRSEMHHRQLRVEDEFDLYLDKSGLLLAIERTFYKELPLFTATMTLVFSDHRATSDGLILPHRIERYVKENKVETILVSSYAFDIQTTRDQFEPRRPRR
jgi:hypothetical protein